MCDQLHHEKAKVVHCPKCGHPVLEYRSPLPTVDIIIQYERKNKEKAYVLIKRNREPRTWALPGGFCEYGESLEEAAIREAREETGLVVELIEQFSTYSDPRRDIRHHAISTVFLARSTGEPVAGDDAGEVALFTESTVPKYLAFDHKKILTDYFAYRKTGLRPRPVG